MIRCTQERLKLNTHSPDHPLITAWHMISIEGMLVNPTSVAALELHTHEENYDEPTMIFGVLTGIIRQKRRLMHAMRVHMKTDVGTVLLRLAPELDKDAVVRAIEHHATILGLWCIGPFWVPRNTIVGLHMQAWTNRNGDMGRVYCVFSHIGEHMLMDDVAEDVAVAFFNATKDRLAELPAVAADANENY